LRASRAFAQIDRLHLYFSSLRGSIPVSDGSSALGIRLAVKKLVAPSKRDGSKAEVAACEFFYWVYCCCCP
jgi:hypothetical protein